MRMWVKEVSTPYAANHTVMKPSRPAPTSSPAPSTRRPPEPFRPAPTTRTATGLLSARLRRTRYRRRAFPQT